MKKCKQFRSWIWLDVYDELQPVQKKQLTDHLKECVDCKLDFQEAEQMVKLMDQKIRIEPTELELEENRTELHQQLMYIKQSKLNNKWREKLWQVVSLDFAPRFRLAAVLTMFVIGVFWGRLFLTPGNSKLKENQLQLTDITGSNFAGVELVQYNPKTKEVSIKLNTINENVVNGSLERPEIQQILAKTLVSDERPNVRLKTVGALSLIKSFDRQVVDALVEVLENDKNIGVRLKAAKLINTIPLSYHIKELLVKILTRVLVKEENPAIRNEAINGLSRISNSDVTPFILQAAENDTSEYVRYKASQHIKKTKLERANTK